MTPVRPANRCDIARVARCREPVMDRCPDLAALHRRVAGPVMARDQEHDALAARDRLLQPSVDRGPGVIEGQTMQIEHSIRLDGA
jgi:hypothetical protein